MRRRARLNEKGPIQLLKKRGFLSDTTLDVLESEVKELFELDSLDDEPAFAVAAKRANPDEKISLLQVAWVACVRKKARQLPPEKRYSRGDLRKLAARLSRSLGTPEDFDTLPDLFSQVGVRLVYVELLPGAKIDGCAMLIDSYPVIGLSGRGKRLDKVLFALLHEIAHITLEHVDAERLIIDDLDDKHSSETGREKAANRDAETWTFPDGFPVVPARIGGPWVNQVATRLGIAPILVIGQLQHRGRLEWRTSLAKNAPAVTDALERWR